MQVKPTIKRLKAEALLKFGEHRKNLKPMSKQELKEEHMAKFLEVVKTGMNKSLFEDHDEMEFCAETNRPRMKDLGIE